MIALLVLVVSLALAAPALASEERPTLNELERETICPTCQTTLELSNAPIADRMRAFIRERIAAGDTKGQIKDRLVAEFGEGVLAAPPAEGFNVLAWALPLGGAAIAVVTIAALARRWARARSPDDPGAGRPLEPELSRRVDEELARFEN